MGNGRRAACRSPRWADGEEDEPAVDPDRFFGADHPMSRRVGGPAAQLGAHARGAAARGETLEQVRAAIAKLPPRQQEVIVLRDVEGWDPEEVAQALDLTPGNQRVLLHRARSKVRGELERYFDGVAVDRRRPDRPGWDQLPGGRGDRDRVSGGALSPEQRSAMRTHLEMCPPCAEYIEQVRTTRRLAEAATADSSCGRIATRLLRPSSGSSNRAAKEFRRGVR